MSTFTIFCGKCPFHCDRETVTVYRVSDGLNFNLFSSSESSDESPLATSPLRHRLPQSMKTVHEIMYKVEVLYVLCVLLMGRQRNQVPLRCPESNMSCSSPRPGLVSFFLVVFVGPQDAGRFPSHPGAQQPVRQAHLEEIHRVQSRGAQPEWELRLQPSMNLFTFCFHWEVKIFKECEHLYHLSKKPPQKRMFLVVVQEISFKIQFLRLLQSFSDHHEYVSWNSPAFVLMFSVLVSCFLESAVRLSGTSTSCSTTRSWTNWVPFPWKLTSQRWKL